MMLVRCETNKEPSCKSATVTLKSILGMTLHTSAVRHACRHMMMKSLTCTSIAIVLLCRPKHKLTHVFPFNLLHLSVFTLLLLPEEIHTCFYSGLSSSVCFSLRPMFPPVLSFTVRYFRYSWKTMRQTLSMTVLKPL